MKKLVGIIVGLIVLIVAVVLGAIYAPEIKEVMGDWKNRITSSEESVPLDEKPDITPSAFEEGLFNEGLFEEGMFE